MHHTSTPRFFFSLARSSPQYRLYMTTRQCRAPRHLYLRFTWQQLKDDNMKLTNQTKAGLGLALGLALLTAVLLFALHSVTAGFSLLLLLGLGVYATSVYHVWVGNRYFLPPHWRWSALAVFGGLVACSVLLGLASSGFAAFAFFSLAYWGCIIGLVLVAGARHLKAKRSAE